MQQVVFLNSHPIQYFAPMYKAISRKADFSLLTLFCSKHGLQGEKDVEFGVDVKWDIPVLEGYDYNFLKNHSPRPGIYGFFGLMNLGIVPLLFKMPKSIVVVHGWGYFTNILALVVARLAGHVVCLRGESPACHETVRPASSLKKRKFFFKNILFRLPHYFLFIGKENRAFYKMYGVAEEQLIFAPYCVDNERFSNEYLKYKGRKNELRKELQLPPDKRIILFSGKYIDKKRPLDLLQAFGQCKKKENGFLVFMGDGQQRVEMETWMVRHKMDNVLLTGFVNQSKVSQYYAAADIFVMASREGETWGLSTNEAMNFGLPVLLSDLTGSAPDLVAQGQNGYIFKTFDTTDLADKLDQLLGMPQSRLEQMGRQSKKIIARYNYDRVLEGLEQLFFKKNIKHRWELKTEK